MTHLFDGQSLAGPFVQAHSDDVKQGHAYFLWPPRPLICHPQHLVSIGLGVLQNVVETLRLQTHKIQDISQLHHQHNIFC